MIKIDNVTFTYEGCEAPSLENANLDVEAGACVLVTGPSGCGKSTLLRLVNGLIPHFHKGMLTGEVRVGGRVPGEAPLYEQASSTGSVFQNPRTQFYTTDTTNELAFALENQAIDAQRIVERVEHVANEMHLKPLMDRSLFELSGGEKQKIACACVQVANPDVIVLDEPTANLDYDASLELARIIRTWKQLGKTILIAEHRIAWIVQDITELVVMDSGRIAHVLGASELANLDRAFWDEHGLRSPHLVAPDKASVATYQPDCGIPAQELKADCPPPCTFENLHFGYDKNRTVLDFERIALATGNVTAVVGRNGRGKTTFLRCLTGLEKKDGSILRYEGETWDRKARLKNVFLVAQDVNCQLFTQSVREEVEISLPEGADPATVSRILESLDLDGLADRDPFSLSGGQKQRVAVACAIASGRKIVAFDEPTSGLGLGHMLQFAKLLRHLAESGRTVIVVTHDAELIEVAADFLLVL